MNLTIISNYVTICLMIILTISIAVISSNDHNPEHQIETFEPENSLRVQTRGDTSSGNVQVLDWEGLEYWNISDSVSIINNITTINKSIIVKPEGVLTIENSTIFLNSSEEPIFIIVEVGGIIKINNSNITLKNIIDEIGYKFFIYGQMRINNSEINHGGYIKSLCTYDTCSGEITDEIFSSCMELVSDDVQIRNSIISYSRGPSIFINESMPIIEDNSFSNNTNAITIYKSNVNLNFNTFLDNYVVFEFESSNVSVTNCNFESTYYGSSEICFAAYSSKIEIINSTFKDIISFLYTENCEIEIEDSVIIDSIVSYLYNGRFELKNSIMTGVTENFVFMKGSVYLFNNKFYNSSSGMDIYTADKVLVENNTFSNMFSFGLQVINYNTSCISSIKNNVFDKNLIGIYIIGSNVTIENNRITNSTQDGINCGLLVGVIKNNYISNCLGGITIMDTFGLKVLNNTIINNQDGLSCFEADVMVENNIIANNSQWGINLSNCEPELKNNIFSNEQYGLNKYGNLIKIAKIEINVYDENKNYIRNYNLKISDEKHDFMYEESIVMSGSYAIYLPVFRISNTGDRVDFTEFQVVAIWDSGFGSISSTSSFDIQKSDTIPIHIPLPDLYITSEDIVISNENPKPDEEIQIQVTVHYKGEIAAENISIKVTANNVKIKEYQVSFKGSKEQQAQTTNITWVTSKYLFKLVSIKASIQPNLIEYQFADYEKNNTASKLIEINEESDIDYKWTGQSGTILCGTMIFIIILIIILILILIIKRNKKPEKGLYKLEPDKQVFKPSDKGPKKDKKDLHNLKNIREQLKNERGLGPQIKY